MTLDEMLTPGNKIKLFWNEGNPSNCLMHIRAIVDDDYIAYRVWSKAKQVWRYRIKWVYAFEMWYKEGRLTYGGKSK